MALHRGIQSAIFYYLSCAPCTGWSYRKKRRKEATRDRAQKHQLEMDQPGLYRHPSPFATNPHWQTEIDLGPSPHPPRGKKSNKKGRTRNSGEDESNVTSTVSLPLVQGESNDSTWNLRRYQREDEDLWGSNLHVASTISRASTGLEGSIINGKGTISRPATARTARTDKTGTSYYSASNPPINDMHPAIITRIESREDAMWMLQPPPSARVMSGKERPSKRGRSDSGSSKVSSRRDDNPTLSRQISNRIIDEKLRNGGLLPSVTLEGENPAHTSYISKGQSIFPARSTESLPSADIMPSRRQRRPLPMNISEDSNESGKTVPHRPPIAFDSAVDTTSAGNLHPRRALSPITSENASRRSARDSSYSPTRSRDASSGTNSSEITHTPRRPALANSRQDSSLKVLQELVPSSLLNVRKPAKAPSFEARIELPSPSADEMELLGSGKAAFENWYEDRDFAAFPEWVSERTRRDVTSRWSVDF